MRFRKSDVSNIALSADARKDAEPAIVCPDRGGRLQCATTTPEGR